MTFVLQIIAIFGFADATLSPHTSVETLATTTATVVSVIDGDTIIVSIDGREETVRYIGIDTPEPRREGDPECGSHEATAYNQSLVEGKTVLLVSDREDRDRYDRLLRYVYVTTPDTKEVLVNDALLWAGFAVPFTIPPNDRFAQMFTESANGAKQANRGNWQRCK